MEEKILVIEDDKNIAKLVKYNLEKAGFGCVVLSTGEKIFKILDQQPVDLIILDIMLPVVDGFDICRDLKSNDKFKNIPVVMLTAKGEEIDRVLGLELGADDYIVKPFSPRELVLRIKSILKRGKKDVPKKEILNSGILAVDIPRHKVTVNQKEINLTAMEFKLLVILMERKNRVQTREKLLEDVWDLNADVYTRTVDTHIKRLREKLGKSGKMIETIVGVGYKFNPGCDES